MILLISAFRTDGGIKSITPGFLLLFSVVVVPNMTTTVAMFREERIVIIDPLYNWTVALTGLALKVNQFASPLLLVITALIIILEVRRTTSINWAAALFILLLTVSALAKWNTGAQFLDGGQLTLLAVVFAAVIIPPGPEPLRGAAYGVGILLCLSAFGAIIRPSMAAPACDERKCGILGSFYVGIADNQNTFGLMMAFAIPVLYVGLKRYNLVFSFFATFLAMASGSRTATIAAAITAVCVLVHFFSTKVKSQHGSKLPIAAAGIFSGVGLILPLIGLPNETFTNRAGLWQLALQVSKESWFLGNGPTLWRSYVDLGVIPRAAGYSTHNQAIETLFVTGTIGVVIMACVIIVVIKGNIGALGMLALFMVPITIASSTERPWSLGAIDWASWTLVLFLCFRHTNPSAPHPDAKEKRRPTNSIDASPNPSPPTRPNLGRSL